MQTRLTLTQIVMLMVYIRDVAQKGADGVAVTATAETYITQENTDSYYRSRRRVMKMKINMAIIMGVTIRTPTAVGLERAARP